MDAHEELIRLLGIRYDDWRPNNYLLAPRSPPGLPSLASPLHKRTYRLRVIDFEHAERSNLHPDHILMYEMKGHTKEVSIFVPDEYTSEHQE